MKLVSLPSLPSDFDNAVLPILRNHLRCAHPKHVVFAIQQAVSSRLLHLTESAEQQ